MVLDCKDTGLSVFKWGQSGKPGLLVALALVLPHRNWTELWELSNLLQAPLSLVSSGFPFPAATCTETDTSLGGRSSVSLDQITLCFPLRPSHLPPPSPLPGNPGPRELLPSTISVASDVAVGLARSLKWLCGSRQAQEAWAAGLKQTAAGLPCEEQLHHVYESVLCGFSQ